VSFSTGYKNNRSPIVRKCIYKFSQQNVKSMIDRNLRDWQSAGWCTIRCNLRSSSFTHTHNDKRFRNVAN